MASSPEEIRRRLEEEQRLTRRGVRRTGSPQAGTGLTPEAVSTAATIAGVAVPGSPTQQRIANSINESQRAARIGAANLIAPEGTTFTDTTTPEVRRTAEPTTQPTTGPVAPRNVGPVQTSPTRTGAQGPAFPTQRFNENPALRRDIVQNRLNEGFRNLGNFGVDGGPEIEGRIGEFGEREFRGVNPENRFGGPQRGSRQPPNAATSTTAETPGLRRDGFGFVDNNGRGANGLGFTTAQSAANRAAFQERINQRLGRGGGAFGGAGIRAGGTRDVQRLINAANASARRQIDDLNSRTDFVGNRSKVLAGIEGQRLDALEAATGELTSRQNAGLTAETSRANTLDTQEGANLRTALNNEASLERTLVNAENSRQNALLNARSGQESNRINRLYNQFYDVDSPEGRERFQRDFNLLGTDPANFLAGDTEGFARYQAAAPVLKGLVDLLNEERSADGRLSKIVNLREIGRGTIRNESIGRNIIEALTPGDSLGIRDEIDFPDGTSITVKDAFEVLDGAPPEILQQFLTNITQD